MHFSAPLPSFVPYTTPAMSVLTLEDILFVFAHRKRKRFQLLYLFFREKYFEANLSAELIAQKISQETGIALKTTHIYEINRRYIQPAQMSTTDSLKAELKTELTAFLVDSLKETSRHERREFSSSPPLLAAMTLDELETYLQKTAPSLALLIEWYEKETDPGRKTILLAEKKKIESLEYYQTGSFRKKLFD